MIICISPPPLFNQQTPTDRRREDEPVYVDNTPAERGTVFISEQTQPDIRINNISVATRNNISKLSSYCSQHIIVALVVAVQHKVKPQIPCKRCNFD